MNEHEMFLKQQLEEELLEVISVYKNTLIAGEIAESAFGCLTCLVCSIAFRSGELESVEQDLIDIIKTNVEKSKRHFENEI